MPTIKLKIELPFKHVSSCLSSVYSQLGQWYFSYAVLVVSNMSELTMTHEHFKNTYICSIIGIACVDSLIIMGRGGPYI